MRSLDTYTKPPRVDAHPPTAPCQLTAPEIFGRIKNGVAPDFNMAARRIG